MEYKIVTIKTQDIRDAGVTGQMMEFLEAKVNQNIAKGWKPQGGPAWCPRLEHYVSQAMIKE